MAQAQSLRAMLLGEPRPARSRFPASTAAKTTTRERETPGWDRPGFDDSRWTPAQVVDSPGGRLVAQSAPVIKVMDEFPTVEITQPKPGTFVYDLGKNFSGWPRLTVRGPAGATVKMIPGELLDKAGFVTQRSSGGPASFSYTLKGGGREVWHPRFSYYGFRYVQVEGAVPDAADAPPDRPRILDLTGQWVYSSAATVGHFACSSQTINRIHELIDVAILSNLQSVVTDCPHREKLGWVEIWHLLDRRHRLQLRRAAVVREDLPTICRESQMPNGLVPDIAPEYTVFEAGFRDSPEWGSACVIDPWHIYQWYGDPTSLAENYPTMKRYAAYLGSKARGHILSHGLGDWYDIGPRNPPGESQLTSKGLTATAVYYEALTILARVAEVLGKPADAAQYRTLAAEVRSAFNTAFFHPERNQYDRNSQTANAMPLAIGLAAENRRAAVFENLIQGIRHNGNRVTAGDVGFLYLINVLSNAGRGDILYDVVVNPDGPGYVCQLNKGATALTEAWDANPEASQNHGMLGHAEPWFYRGLAGIVPDPAGPGFRRFGIHPQLVGGLKWAAADYESPFGRIASRWNSPE